MKRQSRFADSNGGGFLTHLLTLKIAFQRVKKQTVVWDTVPVKDLLLLLCSDAVVLVEKVKESALGFFERGIGAGFQVAKIGKDALLELLGVLDGPAEGLEAEGQASHDVGTGDVKEVVPVRLLEEEGMIRAGWMDWKATHHSTHETYSPVGRRNLRMYWSGCQSTGAEMRKYFTDQGVSSGLPEGRDGCATN